MATDKRHSRGPVCTAELADRQAEMCGAARFTESLRPPTFSCLWKRLRPRAWDTADRPHTSPISTVAE